MTPEHKDDHRTRETREREVIVTNGNGTNWAGVVVAVLAIIVFGILGYLFISAMGGDGDGGAMPDEVDVNVDPGDGSGDASGG